jgi:hypothetical protein|tara:strand:- start:348 stop:611 length:264 start_codon:yes stop_codon:yes gene_type:complete
MKNIVSKISLILLLTFAFNFIIIDDVNAQCPMCKMSAESNLKDGGTAGKGLNKGILYLFAAPYLMIGGLAFMYFKHRKNDDVEDENI